MINEAILSEVKKELSSAMDKFPFWPTDPFHALAIIGEEFGELQQTFLKAHYEGQNGTNRQEAVQVAAMALRFLMHWEDYDVASKTCIMTPSNPRTDNVTEPFEVPYDGFEVKKMEYIRELLLERVANVNDDDVHSKEVGKGYWPITEPWFKNDPTLMAVWYCHKFGLILISSEKGPVRTISISHRGYEVGKWFKNDKAWEYAREQVINIAGGVAPIEVWQWYAESWFRQEIGIANVLRIEDRDVSTEEGLG